MKKSVSIFILTAFVIAIVFSASAATNAAKAASSQEYVVDHIYHNVKPLYNGYIYINDTVQITGTSADASATIDTFRIGFPSNFSQYLTRHLAYSQGTNLQVNPNVPLDNRLGFYAIEAVFSQPLSVKNGTTNIFSVIFVFSNDLMTKQAAGNISRYSLSFPAFPSLNKPVTLCDVSIIVPSGALFEQTSTETVSWFSYKKENLAPFTYAPAKIGFTLGRNQIVVVNFNELNRQITVNEIGAITGSDTYSITNKGERLNIIQVNLPLEATGVAAQDQFGRTMTQPVLVDSETSKYNVTFPLNLERGNSTLFKLTYSLPPKNYSSGQQEFSGSFTFTFPLFSNLPYSISKSSTTFALPEGASLQSYQDPADIGLSLTRSVFTQMLTFTKSDVISNDNVNFEMTYTYNSLWMTLRPSLVIWALAVVGSVIMIAWKRPTAQAQAAAGPAAIARLSPEYIKGFVETYEERLKIILEMDSLESRAEKGKIPRRRYKVQKKTYETRLATLSRTLDEYKERLRMAGRHYTDLMLQLEVAESEIKEADSSLRNIEDLHERGELSFEAYRKRVEDFRRRKENSETSINGILLRFREEAG